VETLIAVLLACIAGLMFYRLVERRHKILAVKIVGAVAFLAAGALGVLLLVEKRQRQAWDARRESVKIDFIPDSARAELIVSGKPFDKATLRDTVDAVIFLLCNTGDNVVEEVTFFPKTFFEGRSTAYDLRIPESESDYSGNKFESDFILAAKDCSTLTWHGRFQVFDSVAATPGFVKHRGD
jgi:hypothetical protein